MDRVVVGVDGSPESVDALRFAIEEASLRKARLVVVHAFRFPVMAMLPLAPKPPTPPELAAAGRDVAERALVEAGGADDLDVRIEVVEGHPAQALIDAAEGALLLVVAARGLGGFRAGLLGSVSQQCAQHSPCPVVIVRREALPR